MIITSSSNDKIKYIKKLKQSKYIKEEKKFIVEGEHLVLEAKKNGVLLETYSLIDGDYGVKHTMVTKNVLDSITNLKNFNDVIGVCKIKNEDIKIGGRIIILDGIQDPGNLGTIIRSANAFNFDTIVLSKTCVSIYNEKVIRATQGMIFNSNIIICDLIDFINKIKNEYDIYSTNVNNGIDIKNIEKSEKMAFVIGNEGNGVSNDVNELIGKSIYIRMNDTCESLNAAVASSIIMYEVNRS